MTETGKLTQKKRLPLGWIVVFVLVAIYLGIKLQAWWYGAQVMKLERRLDVFRPALSTIVLYEQRKKLYEAYTDAFRAIQRSHLPAELLGRISQTVPAWVTLEKLEADADMDTDTGIEVHLQGTSSPGDQDPEKVILSWVEKLQALGYSMHIEELFPDPQTSGNWRFALKMESPPE